MMELYQRVGLLFVIFSSSLPFFSETYFSRFVFIIGLCFYLYDHEWFEGGSNG